MTFVPVGPPSEEERELVHRVESRRLALSGDQAMFRLRCEEVMRWINPPWDSVSRRVDPRPSGATAERGGISKMHTDLTSQAVIRWTALQAGGAMQIRVVPKHVAPPIRSDNPDEDLKERNRFDIDRAIAQEQTSQMEDQIAAWSEANNLTRAVMWAIWSKEAFGKGILRSGWDPDDDQPTVEVMENPSQVYYGWTKRYGKRKLAWASIVEQISPFEANRRFNLNIPIDQVTGYANFSSWTARLDDSEIDQRSEQINALDQYVNAIESWELVKEGAKYCYIVGNRIVDGPTVYPWERLPFHVLENHVLTYQHGKSTAETVIPINASYDDMMDRQNEVIAFESGPRYVGMGFGDSNAGVDIPAPGQMLPLSDGKEIRQLDTRVDFFPSQLHANELRESTYKGTGLTPIAWGMSPNAQTSGRAMSAEWRAVELPLAVKLIDIGPEIKELLQSWWDYAETYDDNAHKIAKGWRRIRVIWKPLDIRDRTEIIMEISTRLNLGLIDPETALEELGTENGDEVLARVRSYWLDPVWNPLRYSQILTLQQLELNIKQQSLQLAMQQQQAQQQGVQAGGGAATPGSSMPGSQGLQDRGAVATQGPAEPPPAGGGAPAPGAAGPAQNQPGQTPGAGGMPAQSQLLLRGPMQGGMGSQTVVPLNGQPARPAR